MFLNVFLFVVKYIITKFNTILNLHFFSAKQLNMFFEEMVLPETKAQMMSKETPDVGQIAARTEVQYDEKMGEKTEEKMAMPWMSPNMRTTMYCKLNCS